MKFSKKDLFFSIFTGAGTGLIVWRILDFLKVVPLHEVSYAWLVVLVPFLWILGVNLGYFLGRWINFFNQFGKFAAIGFTNAAVDFGVLNLLIFFTGYSTGRYYSLFKTISFLVALVNSYILNKFWAFAVPVPDVEPQRVERLSHSGFQFVKFAGVALVSILINVSVASTLVHLGHPLTEVAAHRLANIGAVLGSASALIFSFIGFKLLVFKNNHVSNSLS